MPRRSDISSVLVKILPIGAGLAALSACVSPPRLHSASELASLADRCDVWPSELAQHLERPEIFYFLRPAASDAQLNCVGRWAKKNHLRMVFVEAVEQAPESTEQ